MGQGLGSNGGEEEVPQPTFEYHPANSDSQGRPRLHFNLRGQTTREGGRRSA